MIASPSAPGASSSPAETLQQLLNEHDSMFVSKAYITLLGRPVDPDGLGHYLDQLRRGTKKIMILDRLFRSSEAKAFGCNLPGLRSAIRLHRLTRIPVFGSALRRIKGIDGDSVADKRMRRIENQIFVLSAYAAERFQFLETSIAQRDLTTDVGNSGMRSPIPAPDAEPGLGEDFTPRMRDIYRILRASNSTALAI